MDLFSKQNIRKLIKKYSNTQMSEANAASKRTKGSLTKPLKRLGQNFLIDRGIIKKIIETAELKPNDTILEIGPGIGTLTQELAKKAKKIVAIEKDLRMIEILKETMKNFDNVEIIYGDILKLNTRYKIQNTKYKVVANLPFYLTSPTIRQFLEIKEPPKEIVLIIQKEVAQRICAKSGKMSILAVSVQLYAQPKIISYISKKSFWPSPKVDSAIIKITPKSLLQNLQRPGLCKFFKIVKAGFSHPRKQLINNLSKDLKIDKIKIEQWLLENKIQPSQRAETLTVEDWLKLTKNF